MDKNPFQRTDVLFQIEECLHDKVHAQVPAGCKGNNLIVEEILDGRKEAPAVLDVDACDVSDQFALGSVNGEFTAENVCGQFGSGLSFGPVIVFGCFLTFCLA